MRGCRSSLLLSFRLLVRAVGGRPELLRCWVSLWLNSRMHPQRPLRFACQVVCILVLGNISSPVSAAKEQHRDLQSLGDGQTQVRPCIAVLQLAFRQATVS